MKITVPKVTENVNVNVAKVNENGQKVDERVDEKVNEKVNGNDVKVNANRHGLIEKLIEKAISNQ